MKIRTLIVDGMLSGTGIRDGDQGGYVSPSDLGVSLELGLRISKWHERYENAHFCQFVDTAENQVLDMQGLEIARLLMAELPKVKVKYYSNAELREIPIN